MRFFQPPSRWNFVLAATFLAVMLADQFFWQHEVGWTASLFVLVLLLLLQVRPHSARASRARSVLLYAAGGLLLALLEQPTTLTLCCAAALLGTLAVIQRTGWTFSVTQWMGRWGRLLFGVGFRPLYDASLATRWAIRHPRAAGALIQTARLWALPVSLSLVFVLLFNAANPVIEHWTSILINSVSDLLSAINWFTEPERIAFWLGTAAATYALLRPHTVRFRSVHSRRRRLPASRPAEHPTAITISADWRPTTPVVTRCLGLFNAVFVIETGLDTGYLFCGKELPRGMTYVQYAHRGAYPLIATALLAAAFVLITFRPGSRAAQSRTTRSLVYLWILQNVLLTASAAWRLGLLIDSSLLTRLRLATIIWLLLVAAGLTSIILRIRLDRDNAWLLRVNVLLATIVLYVCCFLNLDGFIAAYDARYCLQIRQRGTHLDLAYFRVLGPAAVPALRQLSYSLETPERRQAAADLDAELSAELENQLVDWRGWTWRRERLRRWSRAHPPASTSEHLASPPIDQRDPRARLASGQIDARASAIASACSLQAVPLPVHEGDFPCPASCSDSFQARTVFAVSSAAYQATLCARPPGRRRRTTRRHRARPRRASVSRVACALRLVWTLASSRRPWMPDSRC